MVQLLARFFIKNYEQTESPSVRQSYGVLCGSVGIGFNILLFIGKFLAGLISNSIAITADAFNNLSDAGSSLITLIGFKMAGQKPDTEHPFGHGRIEYLTGLLVSLLILLMGVELIKSSVSKILHPEATECTAVVAGILIVSILVKLYMYLYNRSTGRKIDSAAMMATAADSLSDMLSTSVVLIATLIGKFTGLQIDGWCGLLVGIFILYAGFSAAKDTISPLLGQPPQKEFVEKIESIVQSYPQVLGIHDLIVHDYGPGRTMVSLHAEVPAEKGILELHDTIDNIEEEIREKMKCEAVIHMDPIVTENPRILELKNNVRKILKDMDVQLSMHDFRVVEGTTHTNLIFDIVVPFKYKMSDREVCQQISSSIKKKLGEQYNTVIKVDKPYTG